jgi:Uma2 family endonuclease
MATHAHDVARVTPEQFLAMDREAEFKSEYYDGEIVAMTGGSLRHSRIASNLIGTLHGQLSRGPCQAFGSDMRVWNAVQRSYTFPDVVVVCGRPVLSDDRQDVLLNPTLLIEVLSDSTEARDRGQKAEGFRRLESLQEYLLVSQHEVRVERYRRYGERQWLMTEALHESEVLDLDSIGCRLTLSDVYDNAFQPVDRVEALPEEDHG